MSFIMSIRSPPLPERRRPARVPFFPPLSRPQGAPHFFLRTSYFCPQGALHPPAVRPSSWPPPCAKPQKIPDFPVIAKPFPRPARHSPSVRPSPQPHWVVLQEIRGAFPFVFIVSSFHQPHWAAFELLRDQCHPDYSLCLLTFGMKSRRNLDQ